MQPGPKPKPTKLKKLEGDRHKERWQPDEPEPAPARPTCPSHLNYRARKEWKRIVPELEAIGLLSQLDRTALAVYCQCYGSWVRVEKALATTDFITLGKKNVQVNPLLRERDRLMTQMRKYLVEFGMTPSARGRVSTGKAAKKDALDELLDLSVKSQQRRR